MQVSHSLKGCVFLQHLKQTEIHLQLDHGQLQDSSPYITKTVSLYFAGNQNYRGSMVRQRESQGNTFAGTYTRQGRGYDPAGKISHLCNQRSPVSFALLTS